MWVHLISSPREALRGVGVLQLARPPLASSAVNMLVRVLDLRQSDEPTICTCDECIFTAISSRTRIDLAGGTKDPTSLCRTDWL